MAPHGDGDVTAAVYIPIFSSSSSDTPPILPSSPRRRRILLSAICISSLLLLLLAVVAVSSSYNSPSFLRFNHLLLPSHASSSSSDLVDHGADLLQLHSAASDSSVGASLGHRDDNANNRYRRNHAKISIMHKKRRSHGHGHYQPKSKMQTVFSDAVAGPWNNSALESLRTAFHFQPENNWMNDPNAPLYYNGWYHLFYQYNPKEAYWGLISWGHAVSLDLIHWLYLDVAMEPDEWYDRMGVWTGSATFTPDGLPVILYTGSTEDSVQVQNVALPADPSDALLRRWSKFPQNPVLTPPPTILPTDFRDPTTAWLGPDGLWRTSIGSKRNRTGLALVYESSDLLGWRLRPNFLHSVPGTGMWECLDFFPVFVNGSSRGVDTSGHGPHVKHVIKASMDDSKMDFYAVGTYDLVHHSFVPDAPEADLGLPGSLRYDYGKFYASKTFYDENKQRRILWGWINESDSLQDDIRKGWASVQALPRQVWFDNLTQSNLLQWPIDEFTNLRGSETFVENLVLDSGSIYEIPEGSGAQWDIELIVDNPTVAMGNKSIAEMTGEPEIRSCAEASAANKGYMGPFGLLVLASDDLEEQTAVYFYLSRRKSDGKWGALVCNDETRSTTATDVDKNIYGGLVPVLESETTLSLRVVVDHSIVETYAQGGRTCITSRVYPTKALEGSAKLFLFNNATATPITVRSLRAWPVSRVNMHPFINSIASS